ncbi:MAG: chromosomal replication initiator protein DnaA [Deltaproteobacteria bacterium]|nr:chromosomal replication initiator protein DnaA [Deltaproteobacteria bacterium]MBW2359546.1 chromosomal replication initiator protein DnaA [Deltaproteobacteria bacterium]
MHPPTPFWDGVLRRLGQDISAFTLDAWVACLGVEERPEGLLLRCPTPFHRDRVRDRYLKAIQLHANEAAGKPMKVELGLGAGRAVAARDVAPPRPSAPPSVAAPAPAQASTRDTKPAASRATLPFSFDGFVVGRGNALAREACLALARDRQPGLNPLYLAAASGLGKTHLARATAREAHHGRRARAIYESAETFTGHFMAAIRGKTMPAFKRRYREQCDLLVLEDVQFLSSKKATQLELFHTLVHLSDAGASVLLTGDRLPRDIDGLDPRLQSQITAGLVAEIEPPDAAVRRRILRAKAAAGGVHVPEECLNLLVDAVRGNVRDLEGALIQLVATASLLKRSIDRELTRAALHKLSPLPDAARPLDPQAVIETVATFFGTTHAAMATRSRRRDALLPRQLAMYFCRRYSDAPLAVIARCFDRDHPAVSNAVKSIERRILERAPLRYQVEELAKRLDKLREQR